MEIEDGTSYRSNKEAFVAMKKCIKLPNFEFFLSGSNESIHHPGSLFQQKGIAQLEHPDDQERKNEERGTKRTIENIEGKGRKDQNEGRGKDRTTQTKGK